MNVKFSVLYIYSDTATLPLLVSHLKQIFHFLLFTYQIYLASI